MMRASTVALLLGILFGCRTAAPEPAKEKRPAAPPLLPPGLDVNALDLSVSPCDDFYLYACGGWLKTAEIPKDRSSWSRGFDAIGQRNEAILHEMLEAIAAGNPPPGTPAQPDLASFYRACMDEPALEKALPELEAELKRVARVRDASGLALELGRMHRQGLSPLFGFGSTQDFKDATLVIGEFDQGGLGLPERDFYTRTDARSEEIRDLYQAHIGKMFELIGRKPEEATAQRIVALETDLARASLTVVERREPAKLYHRLERAGLIQTAPHFPWAKFLATSGAEGVTALNVTHPPFFVKVDALLGTVPWETWRSYLSWVWMRSMVPALPRRFQDESFRFTSAALTGAKEDKPRWKKCVAYTDRELGEALAQPFVARVFGPKAKEQAQAMVREVELAFEKDLDGLPWMDAPTRERALEKARAVFNKIGYPDKWRSYDGLELKGTFFSQLLRTSAFEEARQLRKIGKPVDRTEWLLTPPTVNAYYNPNLNEMVFPAGILQPPFFDEAAPDAVNFGSFGMVAGHELTHGFDDEGRQFDAKGNLNQWWTEAADKAFNQRARCVVNLYSQEKAVDEIKVKGDLTAGENVADMGGIKLAYRALQAWARAHPPPPVPTTLTPDQQLFLGFAQSWCNVRRPELMRMLAQVDRHAPPAVRIDVPLQSFPAFAEAFHCKPGDGMVRAQRCEVW